MIFFSWFTVISFQAKIFIAFIKIFAILIHLYPMPRFPVIVLIMLLLQLCCSVRAQQLIPLNEQQYYQQLLQNLQQRNHENNHFQTYLLLSEYWLQKDTLKSKTALTEARALAGSSPASNGRVLYYEGLYLNKLLQKNKAEKLFERAVFYLKNPETVLPKEH